MILIAMQNPINVTCAIIVKDNKILVAQRSEKIKLPLKREFPEGKLDENEDDDTCVKREIRSRRIGQKHFTICERKRNRHL